MAGISRLQVHLLHSAPPALKSTTLLSRCSHFSCSTPRKIFTPRLLCSTPQSSSLEAGSSSSSVGDLLDYLNESWTQFYATAEAKRQLVAAGFHLLNEAEEWYLKPCGCYFFTRDMSCLVAFSIGEKRNLASRLLDLFCKILLLVYSSVCSFPCVKLLCFESSY
ncbi:uncharacterized protein LOC111467528 [Cucurbita maxima]|uniref:aspartyl aminopeptidase n=1 Tax=Cucurbita maxima TaxID=3661 RepID=A0A6J1HZ21_CUCMA|nr:uncharacterized protein LOC111467528 [Cucurbita maxima]XP_022968229.1 uncharacterized protein LOC111467528 [Cucurbita maxima]